MLILLRKNVIFNKTVLIMQFSHNATKVCYLSGKRKASGKLETVKFASDLEHFRGINDPSTTDSLARWPVSLNLLT